MVRKLTKLRISEISAVDRGAGEGCKIVLAKRDDAASRDGDAVSDDGSELGSLARMIRALMRVGMAEETALRFLMFSAHGRQLAAHLSSISKSEDPTKMTRMETLKSFVKANGIVGIAQHIVAKGSTGVSEHEFSDLIMTAAKAEKRDGETDGAAFSRLMETPEVYKALAITKTFSLMPTTPTAVGGTDVDANDSSAAYAELVRMAESMRASSPWLSVAQAFSRSADLRPDLLAQAHVRPVA
jgi:hypothetical protein